MIALVVHKKGALIERFACMEHDRTEWHQSKHFLISVFPPLLEGEWVIQEFLGSLAGLECIAHG